MKGSLYFFKYNFVAYAALSMVFLASIFLFVAQNSSGQVDIEACQNEYGTRRSQCIADNKACTDVCVGDQGCELTCNNERNACDDAAVTRQKKCLGLNTTDQALPVVDIIVPKTVVPAPIPAPAETPARSINGQQGAQTAPEQPIEELTEPMVIPEDITVDGIIYIPALVDFAPTEIDTSAGVNAVERAIFSLGQTNGKDGEAVNAKLLADADTASKISIEYYDEKNFAFSDVGTAYFSSYNVYIDTNSSDAELHFSKDGYQTKVDIPPESEITLRIVNKINELDRMTDEEVFDALRKAGVNEEMIEFIISSENDLHIARSQYLLRTMTSDGHFREKVVGAEEASENGFLDDVWNFFESVGDVIITTVTGQERIQSSDKKGIVPLPLSQTGIAAFERDTDYTFAYDPDTRITSVEVYDGSVDVFDLKTGRLLTTVSSEYGSPMARADISADGEVSEKIAIPRSEWDTFVAKTEKGKSSMVWLWGAALLIGGLGYFAYLKKDAIMKFFKKQPIQ